MADYAVFVRKPNGDIFMSYVKIADSAHDAAIQSAGGMVLRDVMLELPTFNVIPMEDNPTIEQFILKFGQDGPDVQPVTNG